MIMLIPLTRGFNAIVDDEDYEVVSAIRWYANPNPRTGNVYAENKPAKEITRKMHRFLLGVPAGIAVDHINGNTLDNRRSNLRVATDSQNNANRTRLTRNKSGFRGVYYSGNRKPWRAYIGFHGKGIHLGSFDTAEEAARAYDHKAVELFGEYARPNFECSQEHPA